MTSALNLGKVKKKRKKLVFCKKRLDGYRLLCYITFIDQREKHKNFKEITDEKLKRNR